MPAKKIVLLDVEKQIFDDAFSYQAADAESEGFGLPEPTAWNVHSRVLRGGRSEGVFVVTIDNGLIEVDILPTRGMGIWQARMGKHRLGWNSPVGSSPINPTWVNLESRNQLGWIDGFNELFCRCGLSFNGPPGTDEGNPSPLENSVTLHGKIANLPAHFVEFTFNSTEETISITGHVDETTLFGPHLRLSTTVTLKMNQTTIFIEDTVTNLATQPTEMELLYHCNVGSPFLEEGSQFLAPTREVSPRDQTAAEGMTTWNQYQAPTVGYAEEVFYLDLLGDENKQTSTLLRNAKGNLGVGLDFNLESYPYFALWKNTQGFEDGYCTGLEPAINLPNFKSFEREKGRVRILQPNESWTGAVALNVFQNPEEVQAATQKIQALQGENKLTVHSRPQPSLSPAGEDGT